MFSKGQWFVFAGLLMAVALLPAGLKAGDADTLRARVSALKSQLRRDPKNAHLMDKLGEIYLQKGDLDSAEHWLKAALAYNDQIPEVYNHLGLLFFKKGKLKIIPLQKLLQLFKQDNYSKAINHFKKAISLRPDYLEAWYNMGRTYLAKGGKGDLAEAKAAFHTVMEKSPDYRDTQYRLAVAYQKLSEFEKAIEHFQAYYDRHPEDSRPFVKLSEVYFELGDSLKTTRYFLEGVVKLRDPEMLEELFQQIQDILYPEEKEEFQHLSLEEKGLFFKRFWKRRDPTPTTELNERLIEHMRRVKYARSHFPAVIPPYYDDRGRVYVKYGEPDARYISQMYQENVKDNESWSYESIQRGLVFDFVQKGATYKLVHDLTEAAPAGTGYYGRLAIASRLYAERTDLGGIYARLALGMSQSDLMDYVSTKFAAQASAPPEYYDFDYGALPLPFYLDHAQFKGENHLTRLEVYNAVNNQDLQFESFYGNTLISSLRYTFVVEDTNYNEISRRTKEINLLTTATEEGMEKASVNQEDFLLAPGDYYLSIRIENPTGKRLGIKRTRIRVRKFPDGELAISDVQLSMEAQYVETEGPFVKNGIRILPYPSRQISMAKPIFIYYEIYNLQPDAKGNTRYRISYTVETLKEKKGALRRAVGGLGRIFGRGKKGSVTTTYERQGTSTDEFEFLSLDLGRLKPGRSRITVEVQDLIANRTVQSQLEFDLTKK